MNPNAFDSFKGQLSSHVLKDIESLGLDTGGFLREECCGPVPAALPSSLRLGDRVLLFTSVPCIQWAPKTENVEHFAAFSSLVKKESPNAALTVVEHPPNASPDPAVVYIQCKPEGTTITQYSVPLTLDCLPWSHGASGVIAEDRTAEYFILVCSHTQRDARCGFCGLVLVDLLRRSIAAKKTEGSPVMNVLPCSHVGGHIYAGNVIVHSKFGGIGFGLFRPEDVDCLVDALLANKGEVPESLKKRVRGHV